MTEKNFHPKIYFVRHGRLQLPYRDHGEMPPDVLARLGDKSLNPHIDAGFARKRWESLLAKNDFSRIGQIYASPSLRCVETGQILGELIAEKYGKRLQVLIEPQLREAAFDLKKILSLNGEPAPRIEDINAAVLRAIIAGKRAEPLDSCFARVKDVFERLVFESPASSMFITHDFIMRVIELFIRFKGERNAFNENNLLSTRRNSYVGGFATSSKLSEFFPID